MTASRDGAALDQSAPMAVAALAPEPDSSGAAGPAESRATRARSVRTVPRQGAGAKPAEAGRAAHSPAGTGDGAGNDASGTAMSSAEARRRIERRIERLAGLGIAADDIALVVGLTPAAMRRRYAKAMRRGRVAANAAVAHALFRRATGAGPQTVTAAMFWLKSRAGWGGPLDAVDGAPGETAGPRQVTFRIGDPVAGDRFGAPAGDDPIAAEPE